MNDGGMGSQLFSTACDDSHFGCNKAEVTFADEDGVGVSAALYLDQYGSPYELDMFKSDYSKLEKWPSRDDLNNDN